VLAWLAAAGCATSPAPGQPAARAEGPAWPPPPHRACVRFIASVDRPQDWGVRTGWLARLGTWLTGSESGALVRPTGVAVSGRTLWIADPGAPAVWAWDAAGGRAERITRIGEHALASPVAVAPGRNGTVYVADSSLGLVWQCDARGRLRQSFENPGFQRPVGLAYDARRERVYVADSGVHRVWIFDRDGRWRGSLGQRGEAPGSFNFPTYLALTPPGVLYVTDSLGFRVQRFSPDGAWLGSIGRHGDVSGDFAMPKGIALDRDSHLYVVDALFDAVQVFDAGGRFLLGVGERGTGPGQFWLPAGLWIDTDGRIYVADAHNHRIQVLEYVGSAP